MHTPLMFRLADRSRFLIVTVCMAVLAGRLGGLHVHMCLDGSEPPTSFHVADSGMHHLDEDAAGNAHEDREMPLTSDMAVKKPYAEIDLTLLAVLTTLLLFLLSRQRELFDFPSLPSRLRSARSRLRPPPRGPPLPA
jgi:hypothetical protein